MTPAELSANLHALASDLTKAKGMTVTISLPTATVQVLSQFENARPFTTPTGVAKVEAVKAVQGHVLNSLQSTGEIDMTGALQAAGEALKATYVQRLGGNGGDTRFAPLNPRYAAMKARHGQGSKIGVATGATLAALTSAKVTVTNR